ncbi:MAG: hypothetical protein WCJ55_06390 [Chloroflexales bacterium]
MRYRLGASLLLSALVLAGCGGGPQAQTTPTMPYQVTPIVVTPTPAGGSTPVSGAYPAPAAQPTANAAYPVPAGPVDPQGRLIGAIDSIAIAQSVTQTKFDPNAKLYAIVPSHVMILNLGSPPVLPGWFYRFKVAGSPREFIVQVVNDNVTGTTEVEPIEQSKPLELPIDLTAIKITSDQVFASFTQKAPSLGLKVDDLKSYDLELVNLEGTSGPIWNVFDPTTFKWVYAVSATSGAEVPNPRGQ